jgi:hypothetical protein
MSDLPQPAPEPEPIPQPDSTLMGVSVRAWLALILVCTVCILSGMQIEVLEPLYSLSLIATGFYFGQKLSKP